MHTAAIHNSTLSAAAVFVVHVQGYGVYVFGSGQKYEGHWDKGKKQGWSVYTVETGV